MSWGAKLLCLMHDEERHRRRNSIADTRDETDQGVESEADISPRYQNRGIEQRGKRVKPRNPVATRAWPGKIKIESLRVGAVHGPLHRCDGRKMKWMREVSLLTKRPSLNKRHGHASMARGTPTRAFSFFTRGGKVLPCLTQRPMRRRL